MATGKNYTVTYHRVNGTQVLDSITVRPFDDSTAHEPFMVNPGAREFYGEPVIVEFPNPAENILGLDEADLATFLAYAASVALQTNSRFGPENTLAPTISIVGGGAALPKVVVGETLQVNVGKWNNAVAFSYAWNSNAVYVPDATNSTYVVPGGDVGRNIGCTVFAVNEFGLTTVESVNFIEARNPIPE